MILMMNCTKIVTCTLQLYQNHKNHLNFKQVLLTHELFKIHISINLTNNLDAAISENIEQSRSKSFSKCMSSPEIPKFETNQNMLGNYYF